MADLQMSSSSKIRTVTLCDKCTYTIECQDRGVSNVESLKQLLRTSFDPLSIEFTATWNHFTASLQHDADRLASEIFRLRSTLSELEDAHNYLQGCVNHMKGLPAPIRRLPIDVLREIFSLAVESEAMQGYSFTVHEATGRYTCKIPLQTLHLSQVCYLWRHITMLTPRLWSFNKWAICLDTAPGAGVTNLISHYLEMSRPLPLSLQLVTISVPSLEVLRVVLSHSARWSRVLIKVTRPLLRIMEHILRSKGDRPVGGYFPNLEEADLRDSQCLFNNLGTHTENSILTTEIFAVAPKLRSLVVDRFQPNSTTFPYNQLEKLTLGTFNALTDWEALSKLGLTKLSLSRKSVDSHLQWPSIPRSPVLFPKISFLHIFVGTDHLDCNATLAMLGTGTIFPSLETLYLSSSSGCETGPPAFKHLIAQPQWSLKELCLDWQTMTYADFREMFQFVPRLSQLTYRGLPPSLEALVDLLTVRKDTTSASIALLPTLLHLDIGLVDDGIMNAVTALIGSRWRQSQSEVVPLESLTLNYEFSGGRRFNIPYEMEVLCGAGFQLELRCHSLGIELEGLH